MQTFSTRLLRAFATVIDEGSFTAAGARLGLTQSAVTAQIKRLEAQAGCALLTRSTRALAPTPHGEVMLQGARDILALHGALGEQLGLTQSIRGRVRIGISEGYFSGTLALAIRRVTEQHPALQIELHVDLTKLLLDQLNDGLLDILLGVHCHTDPSAEALWTERLVWGFAAAHPLPVDRPMPMVFAPEPCPYRAASIAALARRQIAWRLACVSPSFQSCLTAARSGFGIVALLESELSLGLRDVGREASLPDLPNASFSLWLSPDGPRTAIEAVAARIRVAVGDARPWPPSRTRATAGLR
jgi:DNA-binding transcriptional LysR family regulator